MKTYLINYITGNGKGEEHIKAVNEKHAKIIFKINHKNSQIVSIWRYEKLGGKINEKLEYN